MARHQAALERLAEQIADLHRIMSEYTGPERRQGDGDYAGPERRHPNGGGIDISTKLGSVGARGPWGAAALAIVAVSAVIGYGVYTATTDFKAGLRQQHQEHLGVTEQLAALVEAQRQTLAAQQLTAWETAQSKCLLILPAEGDERDKARRYGDTCRYVEDVYVSKPGGPKIIVIPSPHPPPPPSPPLRPAPDPTPRRRGFTE